MSAEFKRQTVLDLLGEFIRPGEVLWFAPDGFLSITRDGEPPPAESPPPAPVPVRYCRGCGAVAREPHNTVPGPGGPFCIYEEYEGHGGAYCKCMGTDCRNLHWDDTLTPRGSA